MSPAGWRYAIGYAAMVWAGVLLIFAAIFGWPAWLGLVSLALGTVGVWATWR